MTQPQIGKKYILFGSGLRAVQLLTNARDKHTIAYIIDNKASLWNSTTEICGQLYQVFPPEKILEEDLENIEIILASSFHQEMINQLTTITAATARQTLTKLITINGIQGAEWTQSVCFSHRADHVVFSHEGATFNTLFATRRVAFTLAHAACVVKFTKVFINGQAGKCQALFTTNGDWTDDNTISFVSANPAIELDSAHNAASVVIEYRVLPPNYQKVCEFLLSYQQTMMDFSRDRSEHFVADDADGVFTFQENDVKPIAFYLPQFHAIPENNRWWEPQFTEWTNVTKAYPLYQGHYMPHLPLDIGFYDLSQLETQQRQMALAQKYGIYGFCYYYYDFQGQALLEKPVRQHLISKELNFPFCIFWANEDWTNIWKGNSHQVLLRADREDHEISALIRKISVYLRDERYIRVDGKPIIIIFKINNLRDPRRTTDMWREYCLKENIGEILLLQVKPLLFTYNPEQGFDGIVEFYPLGANYTFINNRVRFYSHYQCMVADYNEFVTQKLYAGNETCLVYKNAFPCWDNTARYHGIDGGISFHNSSPDLYKQWLIDNIKFTRQTHKSHDKYMFINAWNEWAEGTHLEPDRQYGYAHLQATRQAIIESRQALG